jgi:hypothetical protein
MKFVSRMEEIHMLVVNVFLSAGQSYCGEEAARSSSIDDGELNAYLKLPFFTMLVCIQLPCWFVFS